MWFKITAPNFCTVMVLQYNIPICKNSVCFPDLVNIMKSVIHSINLHEISVDDLYGDLDDMFTSQTTPAEVGIYCYSSQL